MTLVSLLADYRRGRLTRGEFALGLGEIAPQLRTEELRTALGEGTDLLRFVTEWLARVGAGSDVLTSEGGRPTSAIARLAAARLGADLLTPRAPARARPIGFDCRVGPPHSENVSATLGSDRDAFRVHVGAAPR